jgi:hypothetical protein
MNIPNTCGECPYWIETPDGLGAGICCFEPKAHHRDSAWQACFAIGSAIYSIRAMGLDKELAESEKRRKALAADYTELREED